MSKDSSIRVRFAPSPTGIMHLGNVRTALLNYLFAQQKKGSCILRIEDTDPDRNFDPNAVRLQDDLAWLDFSFNEGPKNGGPYAPYFQSQRSELYQKQLEILQEKQSVYRCFCSTQELERKRERALALHSAPRYDRTCLHLSQSAIEEQLTKGTPYIWRFKIPDDHIVEVNDLAHGIIKFDLNHFSDFPVSRSDGSFTFLFANCVDDMLMNITHVLRGEDHLSNTANQVLLFTTFGKQAPLFWHLPILCNVDGKKLSKRDFGFALADLRNEGFLPEAIINYLAILGGSFTQEIMDVPTLINTLNFDAIKPTRNIKYDVEKLRWVNQHWIQRYDISTLLELLKPIIFKSYPQLQEYTDQALKSLLEVVKSELVTLHDSVPALHFYCVEPTITHDTIREHVPAELQEQFFALLKKHLPLLSNHEDFLAITKKDAQILGINPKLFFTIMRIIISGSAKGPALKDIITLLGEKRIAERIMKIVG